MEASSTNGISEDKEINSEPNIKTKKNARQKYRQEWTAQFSWIDKSSESEYKYYCKVCKQSFAASIKDAKRHSMTSKHKDHLERIEKKNVESITDFTKAVKTAELRLVAYIVEHNLPFSAIEHLPHLIRAVGNDINVMNAIKVGRTKCTAIIKNVLGTCSFNSLVEELRNSQFSLMIDESTDAGTIKHLALVVRVQEEDKTVDKFLHLLSISDASAKAMFNEIVDFFVKNDIPYEKNMVGFASDGANVMMGRHNSVVELFKKTIPSLFVLKCSCHSFALCVSYACKKIPEEVELLVRQLHNYFKFSSKKISEYKEFQEFCNLKPHKLLYPCQTRWLSLISVVNRVVEQWPALKLFFLNEINSSKNDQAQLIYKQMNNVFNYLFLLFLKIILPYFTDLNKDMQSEKPKIHELYGKIANLCRCIMEIFIDKNYIKQCKSLQTVQYKNPHNFVPLQNLDLGIEIENYLEKHSDIPLAEIEKFKLRCVDFLIESLDQIFQRFSFDRIDLQEMRTLIPTNIIYDSSSSIIPLAKQFSHVINNVQLPHLQKEWRVLRAEIANNMQIYEKITDYENFWKIISTFKAADDTPLFPLLTKLVHFINVLPHSSAAVERLFSFVNLNKTNKRNRLSTESLIGITHASRYFRFSSCFDFEIVDDMFDALSSDIYKANISLNESTSSTSFI